MPETGASVNGGKLPPPPPSRQRGGGSFDLPLTPLFDIQPKAIESF
uniref:Uncharacterized protein n=1 Tax=Candidatus Kentrum sp. TC TaxID=2126339 RepID=A0A450YWY5_9GAMM|nr:MAG: hypothetical protein BECKTC1821E_GA0114239_105810 [Candidatus Kentron sp. TC]